FNLAALWPEVAVETPTLNDSTLHLTLVQRAADALERGEDPTDPWVSSFVEGYPLFHHYQHLPHVATALIYEALGRAVAARTVLDWIQLLLLSSFPLSIYWTGRRLGFEAAPSALAGLVSSLLATNGLYGLDWASYLWRGYGLYTQLWGMWLLGPAVAGLYVTLRQGRAYAGTALLLAGTILSHTVLGYAALLTGGLIVLLGGGKELWRRAGRLALAGLLTLAASAYFLAPFVADRLYMNRSVWEEAGKYDAYGWEWTLRALVRGELLDFGRFPSLTLLAAVGLGVCATRWRQGERYRFLVLFPLFWLLLYFGRPTWGALLNLLPLSQDLHLHRLIAPVHLGAIGLAGAGLAWLVRQAAKGLAGKRQVWRTALAGLAAAGLLVPVYLERIEYASYNVRWMRENQAAFQADGGQLDQLLIELKTLPPARVYAGRGANWGGEYKIGSVPVYALLAVSRIDNPGYLYHAMSLNADIEGYLDESRPATFNLFNLRYAIVPEGQTAPAGAQLLGAYGRHRLYQVPTTGYFDLVDSDLALYGGRESWFEAARAWLQTRLVEARQHPRIVFGPAPKGEGDTLPLSAAAEMLPSHQPAQQESCGQIVTEAVAGNRYQVQFETGRACWLMLKSTFHPGWRATLDGKAVETHMLAPSFVGVAVEPGWHQATLTYEPGGLRLWLLVAGLGVILLAAVAERQRGRLQAAERLGPAAAQIAAYGSRLTPFTARITSIVSRLVHSPLPILLLFILLAGLPTLQFKQMTGHDAFEYLPRTAEFFRGLAEGRLLPHWAPDLSSGYGQPFFLFNPPVIYYVTSAFHGLGYPIVASLNLAALALLAVTGLGMYVYARAFFGRAGGLAAGAAYVFAPFLLTNLYVRQALADYSAMAFIPWALWGLYRWVSDEPGRRVRYLATAAAATALILLSSNPVSLIAAPALVLYVLFLGWRAKSWSVLGRGAWAIGLGLGLSAFFWLPALAERGWVHTDRLLSGYLNYDNHFVYLHQLVYSPWGYGLSLPGPQDGMSFGLGPVHLALLAASLLLAWKLRGRLRQAGDGWAHFWFFVALLGLTAFLVTDNAIWLWDGLPLLQYLEFPWRMLALAAMATAFISGFVFLAAKDPRQRRWLLAVVLGGLLLTGLGHAKPEGYYDTTDAEYSPAVIAATGIAVTTAREYEPIWAGTRPEAPAPADRLLLVGGEVRALKSRVTGHCIEWLIEADGPAQLRAAIYYYPGWQLTVNGERRPVMIQNPYGLIDFTLESGVHEVVLEFGSTPPRGWAVALSAVALALLVGTWVLGWHHPDQRRSES
ncbi:MAG: YfhO family protein, partial [Anaerolineae bacterium]|nr:YfhO family protein [Anaerolineae bacterium]